jgi:hypothetical protein
MTEPTRHFWGWDVPRAILIGTLAIMAIGCATTLLAQSVPDMTSQAAINAMLIERQAAYGARLDRIENILTYCAIGVFGQLAASLFSLINKRAVR